MMLQTMVYDKLRKQFPHTLRDGIIFVGDGYGVHPQYGVCRYTFSEIFARIGRAAEEAREDIDLLMHDGKAAALGEFHRIEKDAKKRLSGVLLTTKQRMRRVECPASPL